MDLSNNDNGLIVFSAFDGMACAMIALERAGIPVKKYYASEIDKYAIKVSNHNYPDIIQLGDICKIKGSDIGHVDLICGGSPCQGFSFAGKGLNFKDERSKLFFEFVRLWNELKEINPNIKFFLENVPMKYEHELVISRFFGVNPIVINAALVSAQNRIRLFWTNINQRPYGLFGDMITDIPQPADKGILLKDVLENEVAEKFYLSDKMLSYFKNRAANFNNGKVNIREEDGKATTLTASMASCDISDNFIKVDTNLKLSKNQDKANCFTAGGNSGGLHSDMTLIVASRGRNPENPKSRKSGLETEQMLEPRFDGKTNCITSVQKDNLVISGTLRTHNDGKGFREIKTGKGATIPARAREDGSGQNVVFINGKIRRLTPIECERLQCVSDNYTSVVSDTQRYKMLGNGWNIDVIVHIFKYLKP